MSGIVNQPALVDLSRPFRGGGVASETNKGGVELATQAEVDTGTDTSRVITPATLAAVGKIAIPISVSAMTPTVSAGCSALTLVETTANRPDLVVRDFSTAADEHCQFGFRAPVSWNEGTVTFIPLWTHAGGQTGGLDGVAWFLQGVAVTDDDTADQAYGTLQYSKDDQATAEDVYHGPESSAITIAATPVANDYLFFRLGRDISESEDDLDIDARLLGITLFMTFAAKNDA